MHSVKKSCVLARPLLDELELLDDELKELLGVEDLLPQAETHKAIKIATLQRVNEVNTDIRMNSALQNCEFLVIA